MRKINSLSDVQIVLNDLLNWKDKLSSKAKDQSGLQIKNAGDATEPTDLVTLRQLENATAGAVEKAKKHTSQVVATVVTPPPTQTPVNISSLIGSDSHSHTINSSQQTLTIIFAITSLTTFRTTPITLWISYDNGNTFNWVGTQQLTQQGQALQITNQIVPAANAQWAVAAKPGTIANTGTVSVANLPSGIKISPPFTVTGLGSPSPTGATGLSFSAPVYQGFNSIGNPYWLSTLTGTLPGNLDPETWFYTITLECVDGSGNSDPGPDLNCHGPVTGSVLINGNNVLLLGGDYFTRSLYSLGITIDGVRRTVVPGSLVSAGLLITDTLGFNQLSTYTAGGREILHGEFVNNAGSIRSINGGSQQLLGNYNPTGSAYLYIRARCYATNRNATFVPGWQDSSSVLQTSCWPGGADHQDFYFGPAPNSLQLTTVDPRTSHGSIGQLTDINGNPVGFGETNPNTAFSAIWDYSFHFSYTGGGPPLVVGGNWYTVTNGGGSVTIRNDGGFAGHEYARLYSVGSNIDPQMGQIFRYIGANIRCYFACAVRSSNNPGTIAAQIDWLQSDGLYLSSSIFTAGGHIADWTFPSLNGALTPPAGASYFNISFYLISCPAGEYWDLDYVIFQQIINQTTSGVNTNNIPADNTTNGGLNITSALGTVTRSVYGNGELQYNSSGDLGLVIFLNPPGVGILALSQTYGTCGVATDVSNRPIFISNGFEGSTETLAAAIARGALILGGIIVK